MSEPRKDASRREHDREARWWRSIIGDAVYALRHQDDLTREDIAGALVRALEEGVADGYH